MAPSGVPIQNPEKGSMALSSLATSHLYYGPKCVTVSVNLPETDYMIQQGTSEWQYAEYKFDKKYATVS